MNNTQPEIKAFVPDEPAEKERQPKRYLRMIHDLLTAGVIVSSILLTIGLFLAVFRDGVIPSALPPLSDVIPLTFALQPSGIIALGLLVLIATPILRVFSSIITFLAERDGRYAAITSVVFLIVIISIIFGKQ